MFFLEEGCILCSELAEEDEDEDDSSDEGDRRPSRTSFANEANDDDDASSEPEKRPSILNDLDEKARKSAENDASSSLDPTPVIPFGDASGGANVGTPIIGVAANNWKKASEAVPSFLARTSMESVGSEGYGSEASIKYEIEDENSHKTTRLLQHRGSPMCEVAFLFGLRQEATLEAISSSKCLVLQKHDFVALMKDFPDIMHLAQETVMGTMRDVGDPNLEKVERTLTKTEKQIAQISDMFFAAATGKLETVTEAVVHGGFNVCEPDYEGRTALHVAASAGRLAVVEFLIQQKISLNRKDNFGRTPLGNAMTKGHVAVVRAIRDAGGELGWDSSETASELCDRARAGHAQQLKLLLWCGADVNATDYDR
eukprot:7380506-Prymnesium_polylepis.1